MNDHDSEIVRHRCFSMIARRERPSVILRPLIFIDGDQWCALYGENLQDGVAGFGASPEDAMLDFDSNWSKNIDLTQKVDIDQAFEKYTRRKKTKNGHSVYCAKGLFRVTAPTEEAALSEARYYFLQYFLDGEYSEEMSSAL